MIRKKDEVVYGSGNVLEGGWMVQILLRASDGNGGPRRAIAEDTGRGAKVQVC